jgi:short-subunit dehydrogenase
MEQGGKVVVITGASAGIGAAIALRLAADRYRLVLAARRRAELQRVADAAIAAGASVTLFIEADVTHRDQVELIRDRALAELGRIDVWINNAGRGITRNVIDLTDDDLDDMIAVNVKSALYGMQAVVAHFMERGTGHVINISSFLARVPRAPFRSAYSAAKAMLNSLTANLRMDLAATHPGIHVTTVMPSVVTTDFSKNVRGPFRMPMNPGTMKPQTPEEVAEVVARVIREPVAEVYTNPGSPQAAREYYAALEPAPDSLG